MKITVRHFLVIFKHGDVIPKNVSKHFSVSQFFGLRHLKYEDFMLAGKMGFATGSTAKLQLNFKW